MSRDDDDNHTIDYQQAFPVGARNRRRHAAANPKQPEPDHLAGFAPKAVSSKVSQPSSRSQSNRGRSMDEPPTRSMGAAAGR